MGVIRHPWQADEAITGWEDIEDGEACGVRCTRTASGDAVPGYRTKVQVILTAQAAVADSQIDLAVIAANRLDPAGVSGRLYGWKPLHCPLLASLIT
jgi:hypothetical protein